MEQAALLFYFTPIIFVRSKLRVFWIHGKQNGHFVHSARSRFCGSWHGLLRPSLHSKRTFATLKYILRGVSWFAFLVFMFQLLFSAIQRGRFTRNVKLSYECSAKQIFSRNLKDSPCQGDAESKDKLTGFLQRIYRSLSRIIHALPY